MSNSQKILISFIISSFWGLISNIVLGVFFILILITIQFNYFSYIIYSSIITLLIVFYDRKSLQIYISLFILTFILILIFTGLSPYGLNINENILLQILFLLIQSFIILIGNIICLSGINKMSFNRLFLEILFLRVLKGFGFTFFLTIGEVSFGFS